MKTISLRKKVSAVAVASLGFGLLSVVPAQAALGAGDMTQNVVTLRTDDINYPVDPANPGSLTVPAITINEGTANDLDPAAIKITYQATSTSTAVNIGKALASAGAGAAASVSLTGNVVFKITPAASGVISAAAPETGGHTLLASASNGAVNAKAQLLVGRGAPAGIYTVYLDLTGASTGTTFTSDKSLAITVTSAPSTISIVGTGTTNSNTVIGGDTTSNYTVSVKDTSGRASYLLSTESISLSENGTGLSVTAPVLGVITNGELSATQGTASTTVTLTTASLSSGTYTLTATPSGMSGVSAATGTLVYNTTTARVAAASIVLTSPTTQLSGNASAIATLPVASTPSATQGTAEKDVYSNLSNTTFKFRIKAAANATGFVQYEVVSSGVTSTPAAGNYIAELTADATASYADVTVSASSITTNGYIQVVAWEDATDGGGGGEDLNPKVKVTYKVPVVSKVSYTNPDAAAIAVKTGSTTTLVANAKDQYGNAMANQTVYFNVASSGRTTAAEFPRVTDAAGNASLSLTDASTSTTALADTIKVDTTAGSDGSGDLIDSIDFAYASDISATSMTAVSYVNNSGTYSGTLLADGTTEVTIDATNTSATYTDQFYMAVTLKNAANGNVQGLPVVFTVSGGTIAAETDTTAGAVTVGTLGVTTVTVYTDSNGVARAAVQVTKVGAVTVTATNGTLSKSAAVQALPGANTTARYIANSITSGLVTATVTDGYGNGVPGVSVTLVATGGTFQTGSNTVTATTDAAGKATASLSAGAGISVKASIATGSTQKADLAETPVDNWLKGVADATATATVATATSAIETQLAALNAKIIALNALIAKIMKRLNIKR